MAKYIQILLAIFFLPVFLYPQNQDLNFEYLNARHGLSSNTVYSILQDRQGFMWFGTSEGLDRYDGHSFKSFRHDPNDPTSISDNFIWFNGLCEDPFGLIWAGTKTGGLNRFDPVTETFKRFLYDPNDSSSLSSNSELRIYIDHSDVP